MLLFDYRAPISAVGNRGSCVICARTLENARYAKMALRIFHT